MRHYTADDIRYNGFNKDFTTPHRLVLCQVEDTFEVWAMDVPGNNIFDFDRTMEAFFKYCQDHSPHSKIVGSYLEAGFGGFTCAKELVSTISRFNY